MLEKMMDDINRYPHNKSFLDIGCCKGRSMIVAAHYGFTKIRGVDISKRFCEEAKENINSIKKNFSAVEFDVQLQDAFYYPIPEDVSVIFLFNPFDEIIMSGVVENILISLEKNPRNLWVIYINPLYENLLLENQFVKTRSHKKLKWLQGSIFEKTI